MKTTINALDWYQHAAMRTTIHQRGAADPRALAWNALGIAGEAGEVADLIKKHVGHGHALDRAKITRELGDVLWYVAALAHDIGVDLSEVAAANIEKLKARYPDGWDPARSQNREASDVLPPRAPGASSNRYALRLHRRGREHSHARERWVYRGQRGRVRVVRVRQGRHQRHQVHGQKSGRGPSQRHRLLRLGPSIQKLHDSILRMP